MGFVTMPAAAASVMLMPFGLDRLPLHVMGLGIDAMLAVGRWVSGLPGAVSIVPAWPISALVLISLGGLWLVIWRRRWRWLGFAPIALGIVLIFSAQPPDLLSPATARPWRCDWATELAFVRPPADDYSAAELAEARRRRARRRTTPSRRRMTACAAIISAAASWMRTE